MDFWSDLAKELIKYTLIALAGGAITYIYSRISKTRHERFAELLDKLLKTTEMSAEQYIEKMEVISRLDREAVESRKEILALSKQVADDAENIKKLLDHRNERESRITALESSLKLLHDQVLDWESKYNALRDKYNKAIEITVRTLENANIEVPDELKTLLGDSIAKFKLPKVR